MNLAIIERLKLLRQQFGQIQIPGVVLEELKIDEERPGSQSIQAAIADGWIKVQSVGNPSFVQLLRQTLDGGEAEAIALALKLQAEWVLLDERDGRRVAKSLGLPVTSVLGVLLKAKQSGDLPSLKPVVEELTQKAGFRIAPELLARVLQA
ncbi:MAG: DUF3368 domain-containing protein [Cyanobacteria bacterium P01_C01_bin.70]